MNRTPNTGFRPKGTVGAGGPRTWQGWTVLAAYAVLMVVGLFFRISLGLLMFGVYVAAISIGLVGVCWLKGEPPRWHWGKDQ